jgi:hypothetical protein
MASSILRWLIKLLQKLERSTIMSNTRADLSQAIADATTAAQSGADSSVVALAAIQGAANRVASQPSDADFSAEIAAVNGLRDVVIATKQNADQSASAANAILPATP